MVNVDTARHPNPAQSSIRKAWEKSGALAPAEKPGGHADTVQDTVELSEGGQKIVNLGRGQELAAEIRKAPTDETFADSLRNASKDIFRITRLFSETIRASFNFWR